mgnify:CR=1 FL=1
MRYWNRYTDFLVNGQQSVVPFVRIPSKPSDKRFIFRTGRSRLDKLSYEFYESPYFGWLILQANPQFGGQEWNIPDGTVLTIPYPLMTSLEEYKSKVDQHFLYYGR